MSTYDYKYDLDDGETLARSAGYLRKRKDIDEVERDLTCRLSALTHSWDEAQRNSLFGSPQNDHEARFFVERLEKLDYDVKTFREDVTAYNGSRGWTQIVLNTLLGFDSREWRLVENGESLVVRTGQLTTSLEVRTSTRKRQTYGDVLQVAVEPDDGDGTSNASDQCSFERPEEDSDSSSDSADELDDVDDDPNASDNQSSYDTVLRWWFDMPGPNRDRLSVPTGLKEPPRVMVKRMARKLVSIMDRVEDLDTKDLRRVRSHRIVKSAMDNTVLLSVLLNEAPYSMEALEVQDLVITMIPYLWSLHLFLDPQWRLLSVTPYEQLEKAVLSIGEFCETVQAKRLTDKYLVNIVETAVNESAQIPLAPTLQGYLDKSKGSLMEEILDTFKEGSDSWFYDEDIHSVLTKLACSVTQKANDNLHGSDTALTTADKEVSEEDIYSEFLKQGLTYVPIISEPSECYCLDFGGYANIYQTRIKGTQRLVIIKVSVGVGEKLTKRQLSRITREGHIWCRLDHPNILRLIGYSYIRPSQPGLVADYQSRGTILAYAKRNPDAPRLSLLIDVARAVSYCHGLSPAFIHGDIRSDNVLISSTEPIRALLCDFGISKYEGMDKKYMTDRMRTHNRWLAFEIACNGSLTSIEGDIYALGCLILEVFSLDAPFGKMTEEEVELSLKNGQHPPFPSGVTIDDDCKVLMKRCWAPSPKDRPTAHAVVKELVRIRGLNS